MFYELNSWDPLGTTPWRRSSSGPLNGTLDGQLDIYAEIALLMDPNIRFAEQEGNQTVTSPTIQPPKEVSDPEIGGIDIEIPNILPDG
jgi:hypothetical protein